MYKIMGIGKFDNCVMYRAECGCGSKDHDIVLDMEIDDDIIGLNFYQELESTLHWEEYTFLKRQWEKIKMVFKLIFFGRIKVEGYFIINSDEQIDGFIKALQDGKKYLKPKSDIIKED